MKEYVVRGKAVEEGVDAPRPQQAWQLRGSGGEAQLSEADIT